MPDEIPSEAQVLEWMETLSNWGRWGGDDQMGCLNLITPAKRQQAASLVRDGVAVSCVRPIVTDLTPDISHQVQRYMVDSGEGRDTDPEERRLVRRGRPNSSAWYFTAGPSLTSTPYPITRGEASCTTASRPVR